MKVSYSFKYKEVRGDLKDKVTFIPKLCLNSYSYKKKDLMETQQVLFVIIIKMRGRGVEDRGFPWWFSA